MMQELFANKLFNIFEISRRVLIDLQLSFSFFEPYLNTATMFGNLKRIDENLMDLLLGYIEDVALWCSGYHYCTTSFDKF